MVTQQTWMFLRSFSDLRARKSSGSREADAKCFRGLLRDATLYALAHLGPGAFSEISGEVVNCVLAVLRRSSPTSATRFITVRATDLKSPSAKAAALVRSASEKASGRLFLSKQNTLLRLPLSPVIYWMSTPFLDLLAESQPLGGLLL